MSISFSKLIMLLEKRGISTYKIKKDNIISQASWQKIRTGTGIIDTRTINKICKYLNCQPGDIMEYVPDEEPPAQ